MQRPAHFCCGGSNWDNKSEEEVQEALSFMEQFWPKFMELEKKADELPKKFSRKKREYTEEKPFDL